MKKTFLSLFTIYIITREILALNFIIDNFFITAFFFLASSGFIAHDLLKGKIKFKSLDFLLPVIFILITIISCIYNFKLGYFENIKAVAIFIIYAFLIARLDKKNAFNIINTYFYTISIYVLLSVPMYFFGIDYVYITESNFYSNQGFSNTFMRLWGLFSDANSASVYCLIAIIFSYLLFKNTTSLFKKTVIVFLSIFLVLYIVLSGSRTGLVASCIAIIWLAVILFSKQKRPFFSCLSGAVLTFIICGIIFASIKTSLPIVKYTIERNLPKSITSTIHKTYDLIYKNSGLNIEIGYYTPNSNPPVLEVLERTDTEKQDVTNGRLLRWKSGFEVFQKSFVLGTSPRNSVSFAKKHSLKNLVADGYSIHNTYLEVFVFTGILGALNLFLFLILKAIKIIKICFKEKLNAEKIAFSSTALITSVSAFFFADMLFFFLTAGGLVFWLSVGYFSKLGDQTENSNLRT